MHEADQQAVLTDISLGGCQLRMKRALGATGGLVKGSHVHLDLADPDADRPDILRAEVRNLQWTSSELVLGLQFIPGQPHMLDRLNLLLSPRLDAPPLQEPTPPVAPPPGSGREVKRERQETPPPLPLDLAPLEPATHLETVSPPPIPESLRVDTSATPLSLEDITAERAAAILGVESLQGSALAMVKVRSLMRAWVEKYGEPSVRERRGLLLRECLKIEGLTIVK